jgi:GNAT superfamily N-acetyltransferase
MSNSVIDIKYREVVKSDIKSLAKIRGSDWETEEFWSRRISGYINNEHHPQHALSSRIIYVAMQSNIVIGFIAGHLTKRFECDGELQWINVIPQYQRNGIGKELVFLLANWFKKENATKICVDLGNENARQFYINNGAENLNQHWLFWKDINTVLK